MIETTGQIARITRSIIAGQPRAVDVVQVVAIDGEVLTYTADGVWFSTVARSALADWELLGEDSDTRDNGGMTTHQHVTSDTLNERVYDALMAAGFRALADEYADSMGACTAEFPCIECI